jgi:hypothetical protein
MIESHFQPHKMRRPLTRGVDEGLRMVNRLLWSVTGIVAAPPAAVWPVLLTLLPEVAAMDVAALAALEAPRTFAVPLGQPPVSMTHVEVDPVRREVSQQGGWWYRGAVVVTPHPDGSQVTRSITNVASARSSWLVRFVQRHDEHAFLTAHEALLRSVASRLACQWSLSPPRSAR